jgi:hypothetical protein
MKYGLRAILALSFLFLPSFVSAACKISVSANFNPAPHNEIWQYIGVGNWVPLEILKDQSESLIPFEGSFSWNATDDCLGPIEIGVYKLDDLGRSSLALTMEKNNKGNSRELPGYFTTWEKQGTRFIAPFYPTVGLAGGDRDIAYGDIYIEALIGGYAISSNRWRILCYQFNPPDNAENRKYFNFEHCHQLGNDGVEYPLGPAPANLWYSGTSYGNPLNLYTRPATTLKDADSKTAQPTAYSPLIVPKDALKNVTIDIDPTYAEKKKAEADFTPSLPASPLDTIRVSTLSHITPNPPDSGLYAQVWTTRKNGEEIMLSYPEPLIPTGPTGKPWNQTEWKNPKEQADFFLDKKVHTSTAIINLTNNWQKGTPTGTADTGNTNDMIDSIANNRPVFVRITNIQKKLEDKPIPMTNCAQVSGSGAQKIIMERGLSVDAYASLDDYTKSARTIYGTFLSVEPFKSNADIFSLYLDLKPQRDEGYIQTILSGPVTKGMATFLQYREIEKYSSCKNQKGKLYTLITKIPDEKTDVAGVSDFSGHTVIDYRSDSFTHEAGHALGRLLDEAIILPVSPLIFQTNCTTDPEQKYKYNGVDYSQRAITGPNGEHIDVGGGKYERLNHIGGCTAKRTLLGTLIFRPSMFSIMNYHPNHSSSFNTISCGYIMLAIKGGKDARAYFPECARLLTPTKI